MSTKHRPSAEYLRQCFRYQDGKLFWLVRPREHFASEIACSLWNQTHSGKEAGYRVYEEYGTRWQIGLDYKKFPRSRLIWAFHRDQWPRLVDHENRNMLDDRIQNLRSATPSQNGANTKRSSKNTSGFKGVKKLKDSQKWDARITVNRKRICLGRFDTPEEAYEAYLKAAQEHWGEFACGG